MIIDKLNNWEHYRFGSAWEQAFMFLLGLSGEAEEKRYALQGEDMFAQVSCYETKPFEYAYLETHDKYIDIQTVLNGHEIIAASSRDGLTVQKPYDAAKDIAFYEQTEKMDSIHMRPGMFAVFFPHDAHMPGLMPKDKPEIVKKVVVKINCQLLTTI